MSGLSKISISRIVSWTDHLATISVDFTPDDFTAGQFFNLALEIDGKEVRRSYSAASAPGKPLEFFLSEVSEGALTPGVFQLKEGDSLLLDPKGLGFFTLAEVPECRVLWLVATGTGLGPYISMLRQGSPLKRFEQINIVHGVRDANQLAYAEELRAIEKQDSRVRYIPTLSGESQTEGALTGRITAAFETGALEERGGAFDQDGHMLLCGNPKMIEDMVILLKARGFEKHRRRKAGHFNFEKYW